MTGYTAGVHDGKVTTLKEFAEVCIHAFIPDHWVVVPDVVEANNSYNDDHIRKILEEISSLEKLTPDQISAQNKSDYEYRLSLFNERPALEAKPRYEAMLALVDEYGVPDPTLSSFAAFMVEQLKTSMDFDCSPLFETPPVEETDKDWFVGKMGFLERSLEFYRDKKERLLKSAADATAFVQAWKKSLNIPIGDVVQTIT